jgi:hypothetical protein
MDGMKGEHERPEKSPPARGQEYSKKQEHQDRTQNVKEDVGEVMAHGKGGRKAEIPPEAEQRNRSIVGQG